MESEFLFPRRRLERESNEIQWTTYFIYSKHTPYVNEEGPPATEPFRSRLRRSRAAGQPLPEPHRPAGSRIWPEPTQSDPARARRRRLPVLCRSSPARLRGRGCNGSRDLGGGRICAPFALRSVGHTWTPPWRHQVGYAGHRVHLSASSSPFLSLPIGSPTKHNPIKSSSSLHHLNASYKGAHIHFFSSSLT
jgi:hypothetical protein